MCEFSILYKPSLTHKNIHKSSPYQNQQQFNSMIDRPYIHVEGQNLRKLQDIEYSRNLL